jgi:cytochrome c-type biogenesis protein CcmE
MKNKYLLGGALIVLFLAMAIISLVQTDIEYSDFDLATQKLNKKVQVKGQWVRAKGSEYSSEKNEFTFFMKDENGKEAQVILAGGKPNNFEIASHVVATGKFQDGLFYASNILTKCPSKYEGQKYSE